MLYDLLYRWYFYGRKQSMMWWMADCCNSNIELSYDSFAIKPWYEAVLME